ncbi:MAG: hypothetical protein QOH14_3920 [Pseudonocardiales bacterium]|nr:hypothetical protein [Pseudonocardiales bacterium]
MIQALPPDRADQPLRVSILPGRPRRRWSIADAHGSETSRYGVTIRGVSVADEVSGRLLPREGLGDLPGDPVSRRIGRDVDPHQAASLKRDNHQAVEQLEADGWHNEQVDGADVREVIAKEGLPSLRWRPASADHVFGDGRLGDIEAQLEQLAVDARCTPKWVRPAHLSNKGAQRG